MFRLQPSFVSCIDHINEALVEKEVETKAAFWALLTREHLVMIGAPGCGKSMLCQQITKCIGGNLFDILLTKFSLPEELFGLHDFPAMKEGRYRRVTVGKFPSCDISFLDETFKASSAIANCTLRLLQSRQFEQEGKLIDCPLWTCFGASNEFPTGEENGAFKDRFLFRLICKPVSSAKGMQRLLWDDELENKAKKPFDFALSRADLEEAHAEVMKISIPDETRAGFMKIIADCRKAGINPGDRRLRQSVKAVRAAAWLDASPKALPMHLEPLASTLWVEPTEQPEKAAEIVAAVANPEGLKVNTYLLEAESVLKDLDEEDLSNCVAAVKKLKSIHSSLKKLDGDRAEAATQHVADEIISVNSKVMSSV
jgi:MoxR-like ATPase